MNTSSFGLDKIKWLIGSNPLIEDIIKYLYDLFLSFSPIISEYFYIASSQSLSASILIYFTDTSIFSITNP